MSGSKQLTLLRRSNRKTANRNDTSAGPPPSQTVHMFGTLFLCTVRATTHLHLAVGKPGSSLRAVAMTGSPFHIVTTTDLLFRTVGGAAEFHNAVTVSLQVGRILPCRFGTIVAVRGAPKSLPTRKMYLGDDQRSETSCFANAKSTRMKPQGSTVSDKVLSLLTGRISIS